MELLEAVTEAEAVVAEAAVAAEAMVAQAEVAILVPAVEAKFAMLEISAPMAAVVAMLGLPNRVRMGVACR